MVKIGRQKNRPNTLVSAAFVRGRTLAEKVYYFLLSRVNGQSQQANESLKQRRLFSWTVAPITKLSRAMDMPIVFIGCVRGDIYAPSCVAASESDSVESDVPGKNVPSLFGALGLIKKAQKRNIYKKRGTSYGLTS